MGATDAGMLSEHTYYICMCVHTPCWQEVRNLSELGVVWDMLYVGRNRFGQVCSADWYCGDKDTEDRNRP